MRKWPKVLLVLAAVGLVGPVTIAGGIVLWVHSNKDRMVELSKTAGDEGRRFAAEHTRTECLDSAMDHLKECGRLDLACETVNRIRLDACISAAEDDGLCTSVPGKTEIWKIAIWSNQECIRRGRGGSQPCLRLLQELTNACATDSRSH